MAEVSAEISAPGLFLDDVGDVLAEAAWGGGLAEEPSECGFEGAVAKEVCLCIHGAANGNAAGELLDFCGEQPARTRRLGPRL